MFQYPVGKAEDVAGLAECKEVMAIDYKLRGCDLVRPKVNDVDAKNRVKKRA